MAPRLVTFSSDYGLQDEFVGVCRLVIARIAPDVRVVDVSHGIGDIRGGAAVLAQSLPEAPDECVHLAVVDPGVGTDRRAVAIATGNGGFLVGPDNGLFFPVADMLGGALAVYELTEPWFMRGEMSQTFHGRDIFAPAAAHLALGAAPHDLGAAFPVDELVRLPQPSVHVAEGCLEADVLRIDRFGNIQLAARGEALAASRLQGGVLVNGVAARVGEKFADVRLGELLVYVNSADHLAIAMNGGSAADALRSPARVTVSA